jgi:hypothetical protein
MAILMLLTVGSIPRSTDDAFHQFQEMFPEPVATLVAFRQHCTRSVQRYLQTGDVKKAKPTGRTSTLTEDVVENVRGRMESAKAFTPNRCDSYLKHMHPKFFIGHV